MKKNHLKKMFKQLQMITLKIVDEKVSLKEKEIMTI
jgi:hypothetical protein